MKSVPPAVAGGSLAHQRLRSAPTHPLPQVVLTVSTLMLLISVESEVGVANLARTDGDLQLLLTKMLMPDHQGVSARRQAANLKSSRLIAHGKEGMVHHCHESSFPRVLIVFERYYHFRARKSLHDGLSIRRVRLIPLWVEFRSGMNI